MNNDEKIRDSNFELMRMVAMFGIVIHHLLISGADVCGYKTAYVYEESGIFGVLLNSLVVGGVDLFILLTGFFGIKKKRLSKIVKLNMDTIICSLATVFMVVAFFGQKVSLSDIVSNSYFLKNWYTTHYIILILISPLLERTLENIQVRELRNYIIILAIVNIGFGYIFKLVNVDGYNYVNFIFLYFCGRYLNLSIDQRWFEKLKKAAPIIVVLDVAFMTVGFIFYQSYGTDVSSIRFWSYNSPWVITLALAVFIIFTSIKIRSRNINYMAKGVYYIFLLHTTPVILPFVNNLTSELYLKYSYLGVLLMSVIMYVINIILGVLFYKISSSVTEIIMKLVEKILPGQRIF
ncbi:MAG: acyltransferase family protein [Butyrivibrio sp.]|nr:acyltransferase family protein [Butyrivibrio sp.]